VPNVETLKTSQRVRRSVISDDYELYNTEEFHMEGEKHPHIEVVRTHER
jgi:hypothetical protein